MGECAYFFKARFETANEARKALPKVRQLIKEMIEVHNWRKDKCRYSARKFPMVADFLKFIDSAGDTGNTVSVGDGDNEPFISEDTICYASGYVWHLETWENLGAYIMKKLGAVKFVWDTDENGCGSLEGLNIYDWEGIVRNLLKSKAILPLLLKVHPDLDLLVGAKLKRRKSH